MNRETLFARVSIENKIALTDKAAKLNRSVNEIVEEIITSWRLERPFSLEFKKPQENIVTINRRKNKVLKIKKKRRSIRDAKAMRTC